MDSDENSPKNHGFWAEVPMLPKILATIWAGMSKTSKTLAVIISLDILILAFSLAIKYFPGKEGQQSQEKHSVQVEVYSFDLDMGAIEKELHNLVANSLSSSGWMPKMAYQKSILDGDSSVVYTVGLGPSGSIVLYTDTSASATDFFSIKTSKDNRQIDSVFVIDGGSIVKAPFSKFEPDNQFLIQEMYDGMRILALKEMKKDKNLKLSKEEKKKREHLMRLLEKPLKHPSPAPNNEERRGPGQNVKLPRAPLIPNGNLPRAINL